VLRYSRRSPSPALSLADSSDSDAEPAELATSSAASGMVVAGRAAVVAAAVAAAATAAAAADFEEETPEEELQSKQVVLGLPSKGVGRVSGFDIELQLGLELDALDTGIQGGLQRFIAQLDKAVYEASDRTAHEDTVATAPLEAFGLNIDPDTHQTIWMLGRKLSSNRKWETELLGPVAFSEIFTKAGKFQRGGADDPTLYLSLLTRERPARPAPPTVVGAARRGTPGGGAASPLVVSSLASPLASPAGGGAQEQRTLDVLAVRYAMHVKEVGGPTMMDTHSVKFFTALEGMELTRSSVMAAVGDATWEYCRQEGGRPIQVSADSLHTWETVKGCQAQVVTYDDDLFWRPLKGCDRMVRERIASKYATPEAQVRVLLVAVGDDAVAERLKVRAPGGVRQPSSRTDPKNRGGKGANINTFSRILEDVKQHARKLRREAGLAYTTNHMQFWAEDIKEGLSCPISALPAGREGMDCEPRWGARPAGSPLPISAFRYPFCPPPKQVGDERSGRSASYRDEDGASRPEEAGRAPAGVARAPTAGMSADEAATYARAQGGRRAAADAARGASARQAMAAQPAGAAAASTQAAAAVAGTTPLLRTLGDLAKAAQCEEACLQGLDPAVIKQVVADCVQARSLRIDTLSEVLLLSKLKPVVTVATAAPSRVIDEDEEYWDAYDESCRRSKRYHEQMEREEYWRAYDESCLRCAAKRARA
jgi:hypothetical protein